MTWPEMTTIEADTQFARCFRVHPGIWLGMIMVSRMARKLARHPLWSISERSLSWNSDRSRQDESGVAICVTMCYCSQQLNWRTWLGTHVHVLMVFCIWISPLRLSATSWYIAVVWRRSWRSSSIGLWGNLVSPQQLRYALLTNGTAWHSVFAEVLCRFGHSNQTWHIYRIPSGVWPNLCVIDSNPRRCQRLLLLLHDLHDLPKWNDATWWCGVTWRGHAEHVSYWPQLQQRRASMPERHVCQPPSRFLRPPHNDLDLSNEFDLNLLFQLIVVCDRFK